MVGGLVNTGGAGTTSGTAMAPATTTTTKKRSKPAGGLASKLFDKFDSDRKYDPFLDADPVIQDSKAGMETLLSMCNAVEINSLFGALGFVVPCPRKAREQQVSGRSSRTNNSSSGRQKLFPSNKACTKTRGDENRRTATAVREQR